MHLICNLLLLQKVIEGRRGREGMGAEKAAGAFTKNVFACISNASNEGDKWPAKCYGWPHFMSKGKKECDEETEGKLVRGL